MVLRVNDSALHVATKMGNVTVLDMLLTASDSQDYAIDVNNCNKLEHTAVYYAIQSNR